MLAKLLRPAARQRDVRMFREFVDSHGRPPLAVEMARMSEERFKKPLNNWFEFLASEGELSAEKTRVLARHGAWFKELQKTAIDKSYKMVTLRAMIDAGGFFTGLSIAELADRSMAMLQRSELADDLRTKTKLDTRSQRIAYWKRNPIKAWNGGEFFEIRGEALCFSHHVAAEDQATFLQMVEEMVACRIYWYRQRPPKSVAREAPPALELLSQPEERSLPVWDVAAAAGGFHQNFGEGEPQGWLRTDRRGQLDDLFVTRVIGHSMEPRITANSWCLFRRNPGGSRDGRILLIQHHALEDPEFSPGLTVKVYRRPRRATAPGDERTGQIRLEPINRDYAPIVIEGDEFGDFRVLGEFIEVLGSVSDSLALNQGDGP